MAVVEKFEEGKYYHIYNRSINSEPLLYYNKNYRFFLKKYDEYLSNFISTYSYCLIKNHFHFLVRIKRREEVDRENFRDRKWLSTEIELAQVVSDQFRKFFISYSQAINKQQGRKGSLFQKNFKRKVIKDYSQLVWLVYYIHRNPVHHGIMNDYSSYEWSSYRSIISDAPTKLKKSEVIEWYGNLNQFRLFHKQNIYNDRKLKEIGYLFFE